MTAGKSDALVSWLLVIGLDEACPDENDVSDLDVAALGCRTDVDSLVLAAPFKVLKIFLSVASN